MSNILCPTRGGEGSYPNQDRAIALAKERGAHLIFLHVYDVQFLNRMASPVLVDVGEELEEMSEFLLAMAQVRAEKAGVRADAVARPGVFRHALQEVIQEKDIATVILGSSPDARGLTDELYLKELAQWLVAETGVEVILVQSGEIQERHAPA